MTRRRRVSIGASGRIAQVLSTEVAGARIGGETVEVVALRGGPLSCGDFVWVVGEADAGLVVEVASGPATIPLLVPGRPRWWTPAPACVQS